ncbi:hypothetical protein Hdeb2414_s0001g00019121 [Helianthus debilis subsp. tardiflorus]
MASRTRSHTGDSITTFEAQNLLKEPEKEVCSFDNADIAALQASGAFPVGTIIRPFYIEVRSDFSSNEWVCFLAYPFSIGLRYPFPAFISRFFELTGLSYAQTIPMVWRVLVTLDQIRSRFIPNLCIEDLPIAYRLRSHGNSRFLLFSTSKNPLVLKATKNKERWQRKFFFVKRDSITGENFKDLAPPTAESDSRIKSIYQLLESERTFSLSYTSSSQRSSSEMSAPVKAPEVFDLDELDSYSAPIPVKKEPSPKAPTSSRPSSSKAVTTPKPPPATGTRALSARKRKETDSPATSEAFPYENYGFNEASGFMTSFLNQGLERLMFLYEEACGLNKILEAKLKKAEVTIADQGMIVAAKSQHYEDKFKAMTQEHQAAIHKANEDAQATLDAAHLQYQQDMSSYRDGLKGSVVVSLLQARLRMAYEAKALGFECPSWTTEAAADAGGEAEKNPEDDAGVGADEAMVEEGVAP